MASILLVHMLATALSGTILLAIVLMTMPMLRRSSASLRHQILMLTFISLLALPVLLSLISALDLPQGPTVPYLDNLVHKVAGLEARESGTSFSATVAPTANANRMSEGKPAASNDDGAAKGGQSAPGSPSAQGSIAESADQRPSRSEFSSLVRSILSNMSWLLLGIWGAGTIVVTVLQLVRWAAAGFIAQMAGGVEDGGQLALMETIREELGVRGRVNLLVTKMTPVPIVWGILDSHVVLPAESSHWEKSKIEAVLRHEMAHIKRKDNSIHLLAVSACALYWFNPLIWIAMRRLHLEREMSCDDSVLNSGTRPSAYARHLLEVTQMLTGPKSKEIIPAVAAHSSDVKRRLLSVLSSESDRRPITRLSTAATVAMLIALTLMVSAVQPRAKALDQASVSEALRGVALGAAGQEASSNDNQKDDSRLFSPEYYRELKAKKPDRSKRERARKDAVGKYDINLKVTNSWGKTTGHKYQNCEHEIKGEMKCDGDVITLIKMDLYDPEDDFYLEARNMVLDPDSEYGFATGPGPGEGRIIITKPVDGMKVKYKIESHYEDFGRAITWTCYVDKKQIPNRGRQLEERAYLLEKAYEILHLYAVVSGE